MHHILSHPHSHVLIFIYFDSRTSIQRELPMIEANDLLSDLFLKAGQPKREGEIVRNPELEATLRKVAEKGAWEFYNPAGF